MFGSGNNVYWIRPRLIRGEIQAHIHISREQWIEFTQACPRGARKKYKTNSGRYV